MEFKFPQEIRMEKLYLSNCTNKQTTTEEKKNQNQFLTFELIENRHEFEIRS